MERLANPFYKMAFLYLLQRPGQIVVFWAAFSDHRHALGQSTSSIRFSGSARGVPEDSLGVGLTLAKAVVERHGGVIEVDSTPHVGTVFRVKLPAGEDFSRDS